MLEFDPLLELIEVLEFDPPMEDVEVDVVPPLLVID
jgi:hypothetical protein